MLGYFRNKKALMKIHDFKQTVRRGDFVVYYNGVSDIHADNVFLFRPKHPKVRPQSIFDDCTGKGNPTCSCRASDLFSDGRSIEEILTSIGLGKNLRVEKIQGQAVNGFRDTMYQFV